MLTGYMMIIILLPVFIFLLMFTSNETQKIQSIHEVLDENIKIQKTNLSQTSYIHDSNGEVISEIYKPMNRVYVNGDIIPDFIEKIFIISEDQHFYEHPGFDLTAMGRALAKNMKAEGIQEGASTITQQLARNLYLSHKQSYNRKLSEILYAYQLERMYSKDEILELYCNTVYFQNGAYGIEAAANTYFQKSTNELTRAQQAFLAAIPNNPSFYDPLKHFERTKARQERLIDTMQKQAMINFEEASAMKNEQIILHPKKRIDAYPDYVTYVEEELKELIAVSEGFSASLQNENEEIRKESNQKLQARVDEVVASGIVIETALNPTIQERSVQAVRNYLPYNGIEGAATVIDHNRHEILAIVGGKNYQKYDFNRAYQGYRQPGSSIKPLLVYAPYIQRTNASLSQKVSADNYCSKGYCPKNYGGGTYGMVTLEKAFIHSYNTPAVRLLEKIGIQAAFEDLKKFQFKKIVPTDERLPAAIGGFTYGMNSVELSNAYTVFANGGNFQRARSIRTVKDLSGKILYQWQDEPITVWNNGTITKMRTLMNHVVTSGTGRKASFNTGGYIGGKTGTTNNYNDYWFIGLNDHVTAGVWVGKDTPSNIKYVESAAPHMKIWRDIVSSIGNNPSP